jgi:hypothetical protein
VEKYLCVVPKKYTKIALAMETLLDFEHLSIEEVTCRLKAVDDREEAPLCRVRHHQRQATLHRGAVSRPPKGEEEEGGLKCAQGASLAPVEEGQCRRLTWWQARFSLSEIKIYRTSWIKRINKIYRKYRTKFKKI